MLVHGIGLHARITRVQVYTRSRPITAIEFVGRHLSNACFCEFEQKGSLLQAAGY